MILSVGEILADMIGQKEDGVTTFKAFCGGAPFNLAVNAKQSGAKVGFVGRVGNDVIGRFVLCEAQKAHLDRLDIQIDAERNTTIAFVTLTDGERQIVMLHALSGLKHREIADLLGIPQATAISRYNRALVKLRNSMGGDDLDR